MTWTKLSDEFPDRLKISALSNGAWRLHVTGLIFCNRLLTDGFIPESQVRRLVPRFQARDLEALIAAGVWAVTRDGYLVVDSIDDQETSQHVLARRDSERRKKANQRTSGHADPTPSESLRDSPRDTPRDSPVPRPVPARPDRQEIPVYPSTSATGRTSGSELAGYGPEWDSFLEAWADRFALPPTAEQRDVLYPILDAFPTETLRWLRAAAVGPSYGVVGDILAQHRSEVARRASVVSDESGKQARDAAALEPLGKVLRRLAFSHPAGEAEPTEVPRDDP